MEIGAITGGGVEPLPVGAYQLVFETGFDGPAGWCRLTAIPAGDQEPRILVADAELAPPHPLLMDAAPA